MDKNMAAWEAIRIIVSNTTSVRYVDNTDNLRFRVAHIPDYVHIQILVIQ